MNVVVEHRTYQAVAGRFEGQVERGLLTLSGAELSFWVAPLDGHILSRCIICAGGAVLGSVIPAQEDDGSRSHGLFFVKVDDIPRPFNCQFDIFALDDTNATAWMLPKAEDYQLDKINIASEGDFSRIVQNPASRLADQTLIFYAAIHAVNRLPDDYAIFAGAICVVGYRILHDFKCESEISTLLDGWITRFKGWTSPLPPGVTMRWQISVHLLAAYLNLRAGDLVSAEENLQVIAKKVETLSLWPSQMTNVLVALYGLGYLAYGRGESALALKFWEQAEPCFRRGASITKFPNYYSYGELENALKVARECHLGRFVVAAGGKIQNEMIAQKGFELISKRLPAPMGWLLPPLESLSKFALIEAARSANRASQWELGARRWAIVRRWFPDEPLGYSRGGDSLRELRDFAAAERVLQEGAGRFPRDAEVLRAHARLAEAQGQWADALRRWEIMQTLDPENPAAKPGIFYAASQLNLLNVPDRGE